MRTIGGVNETIGLSLMNESINQSNLCICMHLFDSKCIKNACAWKNNAMDLITYGMLVRMSANKYY